MERREIYHAKRRKLGINLETAARELGVNCATISRYERGLFQFRKEKQYIEYLDSMESSIRK